MSRPVMYAVWTRTGGRRHGALDHTTLTLCGREHMGFRHPINGARAIHFTRHVRDDTNTCRICAVEANRVDDAARPVEPVTEGDDVT